MGVVFRSSAIRVGRRRSRSRKEDKKNCFYLVTKNNRRIMPTRTNFNVSILLRFCASVCCLGELAWGFVVVPPTGFLGTSSNTQKRQQLQFQLQMQSKFHHHHHPPPTNDGILPVHFCPNSIILSSLPRRSNTRLSAKKRTPTQNDDDDDDKPRVSFFESIKDKPGTVVMLPFVVLVGADLLLNIFFLTKRSIEFFVLGQAPSTETWW